MEIQYYCYTRNARLDYGDYLLPSNLSTSQIDYVQRKVLSILGNNKIKLSNPKWLLITFDDVIVWGLCGWNSLLSESYFKDHVGRPVYGFFSIVVSQYSMKDIRLPYDIEYFKQIYAEKNAPYWDSLKVPKKPTIDIRIDHFKYVSAAHNNYVKLLNTNIFQCQSLGELDREDIIAAALTLDNVSLLIDNDNIEQATNKRGAFMNCLSSSVAPGSYEVKQLCPQCKEYVSAFTSAGICSTCKEKDQARIVSIKKEEEDMDKQLRRELDDANSKILYLQYDIEEAKKNIKKKGLMIKILSGIIVVLLFTLSYLCRDSFSLNLFGEDNKQSTTHSEVINSLPSEATEQYEDRLFLNPEIVVGRAGNESLEIEYDKSYLDVDFIPDVDWVKVISRSQNLVLQVLPYDFNGRREAVITAKCGQYSDTLTIIQK